MEYDIIKLYKTKVIIKIDKVYYLVDLDELLKTVKFEMTERGKIVPKEYRMFFNQFDEKNNKYIIKINTLDGKVYSMNGFLDENGNMLNKYVINAYGCEFEVMLPNEDMQAEDIIKRCVGAVNEYNSFYLDDQVEAEHVLQ